MIIREDCRHCDGMGLVHSSGCNGDPDDDGEPCPVCDGDGGFDVDLNDDADQ